MDSMIVIFTTSDSEEELNRIGAALVERGLAACAQVSGPVTSHYIWQGKQEASVEWQMKIKTLSSRYNDVEKAIREMHSYDLPQIIALSVTHCSAEFMEWVTGAVAS